MPAKQLSFASTLLFGTLFSAALFAQTPAAVSYGSLVPAETSTLFSASPPTSSGSFYLAQNTTPAPILPTPNAPSNTATPALLPPFDPYAVPSQPSFGSIIPIGTTTNGQNQPDTYGAYSGLYSGNFDRFVPETYEAMRRFRDATSFEYTHLPRGKKTDGFGMDEIDIRMQLAFPCRFIPNNGRPGYFFVAPAGRLVWWNGPNQPDMPANGFGAFLDFGVRPKFNDQFSLHAMGRVGIFSDFGKVTSDAIRLQGRIEGIYSYSPQWDIHLGVICLDRANVKMMPTAGLVWKPDDNWTLRMVFPNPKVSRKLWTGPQADWWGYVQVDYSGGSWDIKGHNGLTDYNDIRLGVGVEFASPSRWGGYFEFGGSFDRELYYEGQRQASLPSVLYLKTGFIF